MNEQIKALENATVKAPRMVTVPGPDGKNMACPVCGSDYFYDRPGNQVECEGCETTLTLVPVEVGS